MRKLTPLVLTLLLAAPLAATAPPNANTARDATRGLSLGRDAINRNDALNVPGQIVAVKLDLQMSQTIGGDPFSQRLGESVADRLGGQRSRAI